MLLEDAFIVTLHLDDIGPRSCWQFTPAPMRLSACSPVCLLYPTVHGTFFRWLNAVSLDLPLCVTCWDAPRQSSRSHLNSGQTAWRIGHCRRPYRLGTATVQSFCRCNYGFPRVTRPVCETEELKNQLKIKLTLQPVDRFSILNQVKIH